VSKNLIKVYCLWLVFVILLASCGPKNEPEGPLFEDAWVRAMPPGMKMTAGFGHLRNPGSESIELTAFSSPSFGDVSLHRTELVDGVSKMLEVPVLVIGPGKDVLLEPGSYHLMFMMPTAEFQADQVIRIDMHGSDGQVFSFDAPMERR